RTIKLPLETSQRKNELVGDGIEAYQQVAAHIAAVMPSYPEHEWAREALAGLVESGPASRQAAEVLEPIYEEAEQWRELVDVRTLLVEASDDPVEQLELWREIAELYRERLDEPEPALEAYLQAVEVAPDEIELLDQTEALAAHLEDFERVVERYVEVVDDVAEAARSGQEEFTVRVNDDWEASARLDASPREREILAAGGKLP
ncbi:MAG: hypothetical protein ABEL76_03100, partial [Bradymonadaceae bacterium]